MVTLTCVSKVKDGYALKDITVKSLDMNQIISAFRKEVGWGFNTTDFEIFKHGKAYWENIAQARKYAIKCLVQWYLEHKKNPRKVSNEYRIRINRANEYKRTIQRGFTPVTEWYAVVTMEKVRDSFIIRDLPNYSNFTPKKTTLSMDKALDYARMQI